MSFEVTSLKEAPPPVQSAAAPPFCLTAELKALQLKMAKHLAKQVAKGAVVGVSDTGTHPLTITTPADTETELSNSPSTPQKGTKPEPRNGQANGNCSSEQSIPGSSQARPAYSGPYRGFNRRGKPGRPGRDSGTSR